MSFQMKANSTKYHYQQNYDDSTYPTKNHFFLFLMNQSLRIFGPKQGQLPRVLIEDWAKYLHERVFPNSAQHLNPNFECIDSKFQFAKLCFDVTKFSLNPIACLPNYVETNVIFSFDHEFSPFLNDDVTIHNQHHNVNLP